MMNNYEQFKAFLEKYNIYGNNAKLETSLYEASYDKDNKTHVYGSNQKTLNVLDFDCFAQRIYMHQFFTKSELRTFAQTNSTDLYALASVDAFLVDLNSNWYFIEFKNQKIGSAGKSVTNKAYQNLFWITDLFKTSRKRNKPFFDCNNPISFAKKNITYILVISDDKLGYEDKQKIIQLENAKDHFRPYYLDKLKHYIYKDAYLYSAELFEYYFVKKFNY